MAVAFRAASNSGNSATASSCATAVPTGVQIDDVVVAFVQTWESVGTPVVTPPAGFAQKGATWTSADGLAQNSTWWKRLTAADAGSYSFAFSVPRWATVQAMGFSGCTASGDPFDVVATPVVGTFGSVTSMSMTTTDSAGALLYAIYNDAGGTHTPPTGFTETADVDCASQAYKLSSSSGPTTVSGASVSSSSSSGAWAGALLSAGGGSAPTPIAGLSQPYTARRRASNF